MLDLPPGPAPQVRVGVMASFDFARDRELWRWAPEEVSLVIARTESAAMTDGLRMVSALNDPAVLRRPIGQVRALDVRAALYACTACSFVGGHARERALRAAMLDTGVPAARTTSGAVLEGLAALNAQRVAVVHPYSEPVGARLADFLSAAGIKVLASRGLNLAPAAVAEVDYATVADLARAGDHPAAEALFISCTALPTYDLIGPLETALGKPVITANQAGMWSVLHAAGFSAVGDGQLLLAL